MKYLLIDYENIQPKNIDEYADYQVYLFANAEQRLAIPLVELMLRQPEKYRLIYQQKSKGKNALDCLLVFHLTLLLNQHKDDTDDLEIVILSKDHDYNVVIDAAKEHYPNVKIERKTINSEISTPQISTKENLPCQQSKAVDVSKAWKVLDKIKKDKRPKTTKGVKNVLLQSTLELSETDCEQCLNAFEKRRYLSIDKNEKVKYLK